jgi:hypothetical protein
MVHTLPVKGKSAMLNIAEQLGIRNARRSGLRPYRTRNDSGGSSAEETAAGQCRRLDGHGPVSLTEETGAGGYGWRYQAISRFDDCPSGPMHAMAMLRQLSLALPTFRKSWAVRLEEKICDSSNSATVT